MESWLCSKFDKYKDNQYRFKSCCTTWIVVLEAIEGMTITNEQRRNVVHQNFAHFRGNVFKVVDIIHKLAKDKSISSIQSSIHIDDKRLNYTIGETVASDSFDSNLDETHTNGIHYFMTHVAAFHNELEKIKNGRLWAHNHQGTKLDEKIFRNGYQHGLHTTWYHNANKRSEQNFQNGVAIGSEMTWNPLDG
jgi:antitoxin component YwqK of YwqJK toxin-antitoxin module